MNDHPLPEEFAGLEGEELEERRPRRWWIAALALMLAGALLLLAIPGLLPGRSLSSGTAFAIAEGLLITAAHVVGGADTVTVYVEGHRFKGTVVARNADLDVALISAAVPVVPLPLGDPAHLTWGESVWALGFPGGEAWPTALTTRVLGVGWQAVGADGTLLWGLVAVQASFRPGFSGAPLINPSGQVVGVVSGTLRGEEAGSIGFATSARRLRDWLTRRGVVLPTLEELQSLNEANVRELARRSVFRIEARR